MSESSESSSHSVNASGGLEFTCSVDCTHVEVREGQRSYNQDHVRHMECIASRFTRLEAVSMCFSLVLMVYVLMVNF